MTRSRRFREEATHRRDRPPADVNVGVAVALCCGAAALLLPLAGLVLVFVELPGETFAHGGGYFSLLGRLPAALLLALVAVAAWLAGSTAAIVGLVRGAAGSRGRRLAWAGLALAAAAPLSWVVEWGVVALYFLRP